MSLQKVRDIIGELPDAADFVGGVSEGEIAAAEQALGLTFPGEYREFLREYGCGNFGYIEIFGLGVARTGLPNVEWVTGKLRANAQFPSHLLPVEQLGDGAYACVTTVQSEAKGYQTGIVVEWSHSVQVAKIAADFASYLSERFEAVRAAR
ncbi:SMI1/KNR4 family protein [Paenibacillus thailandensis]|uniref:SMI1/KNR4 family protein n=1 Tax=Paenibacillus thailandensis TaxID=393250 RepID=A0ABW5R1U7_9BACL